MTPVGPKLAEGRDSEIFEAGDGYLVMDRLDGPTMMEAVGRPPFPLRRSSHVLAELHEQLHRIAAPPGIRVAPLPGDRLVHRDLHPMNVMSRVDTAAARRAIPAAVGHRLTDLNMSPDEHERMRTLAVWASDG